MQKIWLGEAKRQLHKGALKKAYDMALQILDTDREDPDAWGIMAQLALEGGNYKKSEQLSAKAIAYGADAAWIKIGRARTLLYLGRQDEARILISSVEIGQCEHPIEIDTAGVVLARTGLHSQAIPCFEQAVSMEPGQVQFRYNLATALQFTGRLDEAADIFQSVLQIDPDHHRSRLALTQLTAQDDNALQDIEARFVRNIDDAENALLLGHAAARIYEDRGDHLTSLQWLLKAKAKKTVKKSNPFLHK